MDQEICRLAETRRPDLLWLALEPELVVGRVVRKMPIPVLITKPSAEKTGRSGRVVSIQESLSPSFVSPAFRLIPALFRGRRVAGAVP
jgi:hypothetical protein